MSQYNIEMNSFNGSSYDQLYPKTVMNNISDWKDNVYSKGETDSLLNSINSNINSMQSSISNLENQINKTLTVVNLLNKNFSYTEVEYFTYEVTNKDIMVYATFKLTYSDNTNNNYRIQISEDNEDYAHGGLRLCYSNSPINQTYSNGMNLLTDDMLPFSWNGSSKILSYNTTFSGTLSLYVVRINT